jgi:hypothetical protein
MFKEPERLAMIIQSAQWPFIIREFTLVLGKGTPLYRRRKYFCSQEPALFAATATQRSPTKHTCKVGQWQDVRWIVEKPSKGFPRYSSSSRHGQPIQQKSKRRKRSRCSQATVKPSDCPSSTANCVGPFFLV